MQALAAATRRAWAWRGSAAADSTADRVAYTPWRTRTRSPARVSDRNSAGVIPAARHSPTVPTVFLRTAIGESLNVTKRAYAIDTPGLDGCFDQGRVLATFVIMATRASRGSARSRSGQADADPGEFSNDEPVEIILPNVPPGGGRPTPKRGGGGSGSR